MTGRFSPTVAGDPPITIPVVAVSDTEAVALLLEAKPNTPPQAVRGILQNSADPKPWRANPGLGFLDNVHRQGAGILDIDDAILATTNIAPGKLSLGESEAGPATHTLAVANTGSAAVTYDLSHAPALSTGPNTLTVGAFTGFATVSFSSSSVTVPTGGSATVDVTVTANPGLPDRSLYGGYVVFTPQEGGQTYRVPYAGFKGDYQSIQVLTPTANAFPWLAKLVGGTYYNRPDGGTFSMEGSDIAYFLVHLDHQSRKLEMQLLNPDGTPKGGPQNSVFLVEEYLARNRTATAFFAFPWDGTMRIETKKGYVYALQPDGDYMVKISVLKALGDESNPAHWETWTSPVITIDRP